MTRAPRSGMRERRLQSCKALFSSKGYPGINHNQISTSSPETVRSCDRRHSCGPETQNRDTRVCETNNAFRRALALQSFSRNCCPAPDLVLRKPIFPWVFFSGGVLLFTDTGMTDMLCSAYCIICNPPAFRGRHGDAERLDAPRRASRGSESD